MGDADEQAAVLHFGEDFLYDLAGVFSKPENGAFITSCVCHDCDWTHLSINGIPALEHSNLWYHGKVSGAAAIMIDSRGPNSDGVPENDHCVTSPSANAVVV